jgi:hypothetical protein
MYVPTYKVYVLLPYCHLSYISNKIENSWWAQDSKLGKYYSGGWKGMGTLYYSWDEAKVKDKEYLKKNKPWIFQDKEDFNLFN